jgi:hypothetical protein
MGALPGNAAARGPAAAAAVASSLACCCQGLPRRISHPVSAGGERLAQRPEPRRGDLSGGFGPPRVTKRGPPGRDYIHSDILLGSIAP